uniref:Uncharacterized protein n=1 Tax=Lepeophtheirus salmonis TaxID=72036 RepID=A0A0K2TDE0_LEPSM
MTCEEDISRDTEEGPKKGSPCVENRILIEENKRVPFEVPQIIFREDNSAETKEHPKKG